MLRGLENDTITVEQVQEIQDSVNYYIENNQSEDFFDDDTIYDMLGLKELDTFVVAR